MQHHASFIVRLPHHAVLYYMPIFISNTTLLYFATTNFDYKLTLGCAGNLPPTNAPHTIDSKGPTHQQSVILRRWWGVRCRKSLCGSSQRRKHEQPQGKSSCCIMHEQPGAFSKHEPSGRTLDKLNKLSDTEVHSGPRAICVLWKNEEAEGVAAILPWWLSTRRSVNKQHNLKSR